MEELPEEARTAIWNTSYLHIDQSTRTNELDILNPGPWVAGDWEKILWDKHRLFDNQPLDDWDPEPRRIYRELREYITKRPFFKVFDLILFMARHRRCPRSFVHDMKDVFVLQRLAYAVDVGPPPTILPAATPEEGDAVIDTLRTLRQAGLEGSAAHLRKAAACVNRGDWAGSVRESIHAVESVARQLDPGAATTLGPALSALEKRGVLHPALKEAFSKLYGYTSDEQGVRHALLDRANAQVGQDEAVFMLGACASFASYLWRRHAAGAPS